VVKRTLPDPPYEGGGITILKRMLNRSFREMGSKLNSIIAIATIYTIGTIIYNTCVLSNYLISPPPS